jgi:hypothetical protein
MRFIETQEKKHFGNGGGLRGRLIRIRLPLHCLAYTIPGCDGRKSTTSPSKKQPPPTATRKQPSTGAPAGHCESFSFFGGALMQPQVGWRAFYVNKFLFYLRFQSSKKDPLSSMNAEGKTTSPPLEPFTAHDAAPHARCRLARLTCLTIRFRAATETKLATGLLSDFLKMTSKMSPEEAQQAKQLV